MRSLFLHKTHQSVLGAFRGTLRSNRLVHPCRSCSSRMMLSSMTLGSASTTSATKSALTTMLSSQNASRASLWLFGTAGMVLGMISVGGITRLTKSGLSMTTWSVTGSLPPLTEAAWLLEFRRYQDYPEWQQRKDMDLDEFKTIYFWEYGHRMMGRVIGIVYCLPWAYWSFRGKLPVGFGGRLALLGAMGGTQGLVGWWMVQSGLGEDRRGDAHEIRVKPERLATHLTMALATYSLLMWTALDFRRIAQPLAFPTSISFESMSATMFNSLKQHVRRLRVGALAVTALTGITAVSGALVAGNDAGRAYNTFPTMAGQWIPLDEMFSLQPAHKNLIQNTAMVQWNHRVLGTTTAVSALALSLYGLRATPTACLPVPVRYGLAATGLAATCQFALGVTTLLTYVPVPLAALHQLGSVAVLTSGLYTAHALRAASRGLPVAAAKVAKRVVSQV